MYMKQVVYYFTWGFSNYDSQNYEILFNFITFSNVEYYHADLVSN